METDVGTYLFHELGVIEKWHNKTVKFKMSVLQYFLAF